MPARKDLSRLCGTGVSQGLQGLLTARAVRERCTFIGELALRKKTRWFTINESNIDACADLVTEVCKQSYPQLDIPYHSRWRHFIVSGTDLWEHYSEQRLADVDSAMRTRTAIDLVFVSVLLDAGAGSKWSFIDPVTGTKLYRSEGLAAASVDLFFNRLAKYQVDKGWYVDAKALHSLTLNALAESFQHTGKNPLIGLEGRLRLLRGLGSALSEADALLRPGHIYDVLISKSPNGQIGADEILHEVLVRFGTIWPNGLVHDDLNLGDAGYHRLLQTQDSTNHIVPFHKLSQWLTYSLFEPLQWGGMDITGLDELTGLPEYRNGGLLIDTAVIEPVHAELLEQTLSVRSEAVVEWRALTVFLLDKIADSVRKRLRRDQLPLSSILQGGTWTAGRQIAAQRRADGSPPIKLAIDGTVF